jgi:hypothetical protein
MLLPHQAVANLASILRPDAAILEPAYLTDNALARCGLRQVWQHITKTFQVM